MKRVGILVVAFVLVALVSFYAGRAHQKEIDDKEWGGVAERVKALIPRLEEVEKQISPKKDQDVKDEALKQVVKASSK